MNPQELNRVYEALQNAHNAGDTKAAEQLAQYARQLEDQTKLDTTPFASSEGGIGDKYIHNPLTYGAAGFFGGMAVPEAMSKVANVVTPKPRPTPSAVPSTPSVQSAPASVSQHPGSLGPGAVKNIQHNIGQVIGNDLHLGLARNPVPGFGLAPDALVITPNGMKGAAPAAPKARPSISAMKNAVKNTMQAQHPVPPGRLRGALSGGVAAGSAIDAVQQAREGNVLPAAASTLSTLGGVGMASKNPKVALAGGLASLLGMGGRMLFGNKEEEKEPEPPADKNWMWGGKQFAVGGAIQGYSKGKVVKGVLDLIGKEPRAIQTVADPLRMAYPGIYKRPDVIAAEAAARVAPESEALKQVFGVTRGDLYEMGKGRVGNLPGTLPGAAATPKGSKAAAAVMTPQNEQRLIDVMSEAEKYPALVQGMDPWYVMDPMYMRMEQLLGPEAAAAEYRKMNTLMGMASPGSEVLTEIPRGTAAYYLQKQGRFPEFVQYAGKSFPARGADFPADIRNVPGHAYHKTAQATPMQQFLETGEMQMSSPKVPMYIEASGVPQTGFQTATPVGDAHWSRAVGLADTRGAATRKGQPVVPGASVSNPEMSMLAPWWKNQIAAPLGLESVPAQARAWGAFSPQTGVTSPIGAPKLELVAQKIMETASRMGVSPETARDMVLTGKTYAGKKEGGLAHLAGGGQPIKMFQQLYRGYAGKPGADEIFASPQKRVAEYYAQKRAAQTGLQPGVEAVQVDPSAGVKYGHALPIDQFNQEVVTTQARKLSPLDVLTPKPNRMTEFELSMAEQIDQMRQAKKAQDARLAEYYRQKAGQHTVEPRPAQDLGRSVAELAESMEARYK